jgi:hypothetical protein
MEFNPMPPSKALRVLYENCAIRQGKGVILGGVSIALCDPNHVDHQRVSVWFKEVGGKAWVSCPITENGFIRILSNLV